MLHLGAKTARADTQIVSHDLDGNLISQSTFPTVAAPEILAQPRGVLGRLGGTAVFSVKACGTPAPAYQWQLDGVNIPAASNASAVIDTLRLSHLDAPSFGSYRVTITNVADSVTSESVALQFDSAGDGIPDNWKEQYFGANWADASNTAAPGADFDGDGISNAEEYLDGTDPASAASRFYRLTVSGLNPAIVQPAADRFAPGTAVTLTALPVGDLQFGGWTGDVSSLNNPLALTMDRDYKVTPLLGALPLDVQVSSFTTSGAATVIRALAVQSDGKVIAGGAFQAEDGVPHYGIARVNVDGSPDHNFTPFAVQGPNGLSATAFSSPGNVSFIALQPDGKILIAGEFGSVDGVSSTPLSPGSTPMAPSIVRSPRRCRSARLSPGC